MSRQTIHSVGIDVGTTTSQAIFSELELVNRAAASEVPRYDFSARRITHVSPVVFTPRTADDAIDGLELLHFIDGQYAQAGLTPASVQSGAIIITGEASKARNARETVMELAGQLGDFVVATAGPHLESIIAGQGSGAAAYSRAHGARVLNIDIGGGTANYAVFVAGQLRDMACLNVGGRLIETDGQGRVRRVHAPAQRVAAALGIPVPDTGAAASTWAPVVEAMAALIVQVLQGQTSALAQALLMTAPLKECAPYDAVFLSGGVGECYYRGVAGQAHRFGDVGPALAAALHANADLARLPVREPANTLRATVIGAGLHTLTLSGSTIWLSLARLPLCNVPVLHALGAHDTRDAQALSQAWQNHARLQDLSITEDCHALAIPASLPVRYQAVQLCAQAIRDFARHSQGNPWPVVVLAAQDFGKALGMELQPFPEARELAVIDEVEVREWDYIDIGKGMFDDAVVPLTVKSLAFPSQEGSMG